MNALEILQTIAKQHAQLDVNRRAHLAKTAEHQSEAERSFGAMQACEGHMKLLTELIEKQQKEALEAEPPATPLHVVPKPGESSPAPQA